MDYPFPITPRDPDKDSFRWAASSQRLFLETLAATGSAQRASDAAGKSRKCAFALRRRSKGSAFATGWDAALLIAQRLLSGKMMEYALAGIDDISHRHPESGRLMWRRADPLMGRGQGMALLHRVDRAVEAIERDATRLRAAIEASGDWENFLNGVCAPQPFIGNLARDSAIFRLPDEAQAAMSIAGEGEYGH
jgi:hypothetical protein